MSNTYKVKTEKFEGPLDLLLHFIEKRKFFINDISLAQIADDYIEYLRNSGDFSIKGSSDFVLVASTLMLIKSKSLLPTIDLTSEEEKTIDDLEDRLKMYKQYKDLSLYVKELFGQKIIFPKTESNSQREIVFSPDESITLKNIFASAVDALVNIPKKEVKPKGAIRKTISLDEMIDKLTERIKSNIRMSFKDFSSMGKAEKVNVVVSFLAMLELVKQGVLEAQQQDNFGDISMENKDIGVPNYG